jgi:hypothetical protein
VTKIQIRKVLTRKNSKKKTNLKNKELKMRPIERKILQKLTENGLTFDEIMEIIDKTPRTEMKKSFPDDCHFQSDRYFAKIIIDSLLRNRYIKMDKNKYIKIEPKKTEEKKD